MSSKIPQEIPTKRRYGSETDVAALTGRSKRTLQKDRLFGKGFPYYKVLGQVRYDLDEVEAIVRAGRVNTTEAA